MLLESIVCADSPRTFRIAPRAGLLTILPLWSLGGYGRIALRSGKGCRQEAAHLAQFMAKLTDLNGDGELKPQAATVTALLGWRGWCSRWPASPNFGFARAHRRSSFSVPFCIRACISADSQGGDCRLAAHPTLGLFHGIPGNKKNLGLAQARRRAGSTVVTVNDRGTWGSPGNYSFVQNLEDAEALARK